ncbi:MAG: NUDIX domain-containing protein [Caldilineaceae bacterium]
MLKFDSIQQLTQWLNHHGIPTNTWGQGDAKTVADLWLEVTHGETILQLVSAQVPEPLTASPVRLVQVVELLIQRQDHTLIEAGQLLTNGTERHRNHLPAEKMKGGETPLAAAWRCLREELAASDEVLAEVEVVIIEDSLKKRFSPSYPGLQSEYHLYRAQVTGLPLPADDFSTENRAYCDGDPVKMHHWHWKKWSDH